MVLFRAASPLSRLLLERALGCPRQVPLHRLLLTLIFTLFISCRVSHSLYWLLTQALPGISPQVSLCCIDLQNLLLFYKQFSCARLTFMDFVR